MGVLTRDRMETIINIRFACNLLRQGMKQVSINLDSPNIKTLEKIGDKDVISKVLQGRVLHQITQETDQLVASSARFGATILTSYKKSSQGYNISSWATGLNSFVPNGSPVWQFSFTHTVETNGPLQYDSREPDTVLQHLVPNGHHHAPHAGRPSVGRPPHALVTFGFGGKLIVMKDNSILENSLHGNNDAENHSIAVVVLMEAVKEKVIASGVTTWNCNYFHALHHQSLPGPLVGGTMGNKELQK
ncbi:hypothetical protein Nepgr_032648 [Nepenthes gracilis]|uniref:Sec16 central conserved domain-containing protein n=1 Tax=Nepenthes gracilis TaxID=150966 RepID=A0AAD3TJS5_NEPGR|nr:hypothetical protein Nepgr_032648 [Nepenthes gracilis]